jgi:hypothetical protein
MNILKQFGVLDGKVRKKVIPDYENPFRQK